MLLLSDSGRKWNYSKSSAVWELNVAPATVEGVTALWRPRIDSSRATVRGWTCINTFHCNRISREARLAYFLQR